MRFLQIFLLSLAVPFLACGQMTLAVGGHVGNFDFAVSNYYRVPEREVMVIRERRLPEEDVPVVLFLAQQARVAAILAKPCMESVSWRASVQLSWTCQFIRYPHLPGMQITTIRLSGKNLFVDVTFVAPPKWARVK